MKKIGLLLTVVLVAASMTTGCDLKEASKKEDTKSGTASSVQIKETSAVQESGSASEESTQESAQESAQESKTESSVPAGTPVDAGWFDDAVFIGDSVTLKLSFYCENHDDLGEAEFLCAGSLGYNNAQMGLYDEDNVHPVYNGEKILVDDGAAATGAKKIFIMLGMNDIGLYGVDGAVEGMKVITDRIAAKCPGAEIYVESVTPMLENMQLTDLNNTTIAEFNEKIQPICAEKGYHYLDVASAMGDGNGNLVYEYCGDPDAMGLHFSDLGCEIWIEYLKTHVGA